LTNQPRPITNNANQQEIQMLIHDLQVREADLEIQCQSMQETLGELEESLSRYAELYDFAPVGYATFDDKGCIREINLTGAALLGRERSQLIGFPMAAFVSKDSKKLFFDHLRVCKLSGEQAIT
jgi:PAS domain-containing protein